MNVHESRNTFGCTLLEEFVTGIGKEHFLLLE